MRRFGPSMDHRDSFGPVVGDYAFTVYIAMNDPSEYDGGDILVSKSLSTFDETPPGKGRRASLLPFTNQKAGDAVIVSKPGISKISKVTRGIKYVLVIRAGVYGKNVTPNKLEEELEKDGMDIAEAWGASYAMGAGEIISQEAIDDEKKQAHDENLRRIVYGLSKLRSWLKLYLDPPKWTYMGGSAAR